MGQGMETGGERWGRGPGLRVSGDAFEGPGQGMLWGALGDGAITGSVSKETISGGLSPAGFGTAGL